MQRDDKCPGKSLEDEENEDAEDMFHLFGHNLSVEPDDTEDVQLLKQEAL